MANNLRPNLPNRFYVFKLKRYGINLKNETT